MSSKKWTTPEEFAQKERERLVRERSQMIEAARQYAKADRTDPFAFNRAMSHVNNGVASFRRPASERGAAFEVSQGDGYYKATPYREARTLVGYDGKPSTYDVVRYNNVSRP